jgi:RND family efflux transporter MFP subunit
MTNRCLFQLAIALPLILLTAHLHPAFSQADGSAPVEQTFKGIVAPALSYDIPPPPDGHIVKIHFAPGQFVERGALLFTFDTTKEDLELERDQALLLRAEAQLRIAEQAVKNNTELRRRNAVSERQSLEAEAQRDIAAANAAEARVQVKSDEVKISELKRYAPFAGIMSRPTVAEGALLVRTPRENASMATITVLDPIQVKTSIPYEVYVDHLKLLTADDKSLDRQRARDRIEIFVTLPNGQRLSQPGKIVGGYEFDPVTQNMEVMVDFPNPGLLLRPGLWVRLDARVKPASSTQTEGMTR